MSSNVAEQEKAELFPTAEGRQVQEHLSVSEPQRSSLRAIPPMHLLAHHGSRQDWKSQCGTGLLLNTPSCSRCTLSLTPTLPVLHLHKKSMVAFSWSWLCPAKLVPKLMDSPQPYLWRIQLAPRCCSSEQGGYWLQDHREEATDFGKTSLGKPEKNVAVLLSLLLGNSWV